MIPVVDPQSGEPPFEQVRRQIAEGAASGSLPPGHRLPTVRAMATSLGLAVNTVAKAYRALEADGVVETRGRAGTVVATRHAADHDTDAAAQAFVLHARRQGLSKDEAVRLLDQHWT
jgi:DNA-binding transcriptional regulator YhcF (GntR family)